jgi:uncharacterized membrane protein
VTPSALGLILLAAVTHATWNALVKGSGDRGLTLASVAFMHALLGFGMVLAFPVPLAESWPFLALSAAIHWAYYYMLFEAYWLGDLSQVYPISRGMSPALVAGGAFLFLGEDLGFAGWAGLGLVTFGIALIAWRRGAAHASRPALVAAFILGAMIGSYSLADGMGVRLSGNPFGYMGWLFLSELPIPMALVIQRWRKGQAMDLRKVPVGLAGGALSVLAYGLVLYAKTLAPLGAVSAVRESSVVIAALIGVFLFGERPATVRLAAASLVACGVILLANAG